MLIEKVGVREKMYFDWTYLVLVVPAMIFAMWASNRVDKTFEKYQAQYSAKRITGAEAARQILNANGLRNVPIDLITGNLTDHYDPMLRQNTTVLKMLHLCWSMFLISGTRQQRSERTGAGIA